MTMTLMTTLVRPVAGKIDVDFADLSPEQQRLAAQMGSVSLAKITSAMERALPKSDNSPAVAMTKEEYQRQLRQLTLQTGSEARARTILATRVPG